MSSSPLIVSLKFVALVLFFLLKFGNCQLAFNISYVKDPEPVPTSVDVGKTLKPNQDWFINAVEYSFEADDLGNLFAGRQEFPWVVDIRAEDMDQEFWAVGNIVSFRHVLTTCRFLFFHTRHVANKEWALEYFNPAIVLVPGAVWKTYEKVKKPLRGIATQIEVRYATTYLWDFYRPSKASSGRVSHLFSRDSFESGTRLAKELIMHPECNFKVYKKDVGIIELMNSITPMVVNRGYMPVNIKEEDKETRSIILDTLDNHIRDNIVCYIASFGRNYYNIQYHQAIDYKIRYRVYKVPLKECFITHYPKYTCGQTQGLCAINFTDEVFDHLMCFNSRAMVGAVCDHDNGAPLVCDERVYGIVVRGATYQYCHDLIPIPFLVLNVYSFADYFMAYSKSQSTYDRVASDYFRGKKSPELPFSVGPISAGSSIRLVFLTALSICLRQ